MIKPYIVEKQTIRIIGKRVLIGPGDEKNEISKLWETYEDTFSRIPNRIDSLFLGISIDFWHPNRNDETYSAGLRSYMIGAEVTDLTTFPIDMESRIIPASRWVYLPIDHSDSALKSLAPDEFKDDPGYLTGCAFKWLNDWIKDNGYERQDYPDELEIYGLNGVQSTLAIAIQ